MNPIFIDILDFLLKKVDLLLITQFNYLILMIINLNEFKPSDLNYINFSDIEILLKNP